MIGNVNKQLILYSIARQVILKTKLWQNGGLVNGSRGKVRHILYKPNSSPPALPECVLVHFADYKGPSINPFSDDEKIVPIFPHTATWYNKNTPCSRTQIPLIPGLLLNYIDNFFKVFATRYIYNIDFFIPKVTQPQFMLLKVSTGCQ